MKQRIIIFGLVCLNVFQLIGAEINLAGQWQLQLDSKGDGEISLLWGNNLNDTITLPGTTALAGKGEALDIPINLERPAMQSLHQRFRYVGPAWYQRVVKVPKDWREQDVILTLERVIWESRVWVNGVEAGEPQLSLTTPHRYDVTKLLKPGADNTITIRIDNREKVPIGVLGHSYTDETQTIWNGIIGKIALDTKPKLRIEALELRANVASNGVNVGVRLVNHTGLEQTAPLLLKPSVGNQSIVQPIKISPGDSWQNFFVALPADAPKWSEFTPTILDVAAELGSGKNASKLVGHFGLREFKATGRSFTINGQPTFLRGTVQCAEFPQTGHPDMTGKQWEKIFKTAKAYGLNHFRFHSWCPPEVAFEMADHYGFYLQVELPNWTFKMGQVPVVDNWLMAEAQRMIREYGNHPSWVMLSLGNELTGDYAKMDDMVSSLRQVDPQLMFTSTTYSFSPRGKLPGSNDDYFISQETSCGWVRGQGFLNNTKPNTTSDYAEGAACINIPLVTHEVGQYVVYPNLAELPKYDSTPMRATAWEAIKADLETKHRVDEAGQYTRDSGKLAALLYKEDLERAMRTKGVAGIQLLQLQDFPGQSTATVGLLDAFWDSKGIITPAEFRQFCSPVVPLIRMPKVIYQNDETFEAAAEMANFGATPLTNAIVIWKIFNADKVVGEGKFASSLIPLGNGISLGNISQSLSAVKDAAKLSVKLAVVGTAIENQWSIWVYPAKAAEAKSDVQIFETASEKFYQALRDGKKVLLLPARASVKSPIDGRFIPVFWSPLHFPNQPGTLGATIDTSHPLWSDFPTGTATDWQWWELLSHSFAVDMDSFPVKLVMPFRFVDKYNRNALPAAIFEAQVGNGRLLVCTLDIEQDLNTRLVARQLRRSILSYMDSDEFKPLGSLAENDLKHVFQSVRYTVTASSSHDSYPPELAVDDNPKTIWHTDWMTGDKLPAQFTLDLRHEVLLKGFNYLPRQDTDRGRIKNYAIDVSLDGKQWLSWIKEGSFPNTMEKQSVKFDQVVQAHFLRLTTLSDHGNAHHAAIAEIEPVMEEITPDVRKLGIVPGFNNSSK